MIATLGVAQILAWGSSYYLIAVLAKPIAAGTGWPMEWIVGGLSLGLLISGLVSPAVGRLIEARGGRPVLMASAGLLAAGLVTIGLAPALPVFVAGWAVLVGIVLRLIWTRMTEGARRADMEVFAAGVIAGDAFYSFWDMGHKYFAIKK